MDYRELAQLNNILPPYRIFVGQTLRFSNKKYTSIRGEQRYSSVKVPKIATATVKKPPRTQSKLTTANKAVARNNQTGYVRKQTVKENATSAENSVSSSKVRWSWPVRGPLLAGFSNAEHGNKGLDIWRKSRGSYKSSCGG